MVERFIKRILILLFFVFVSTGIKAQKGNPFLTNYNLPYGLSNQNWGFQQGHNGLMYMLNRKGIYSFDGTAWENMNINGRPIAMAYSKYLFYCSNRGIGYVMKTSDGKTEDIELLSISDNNVFFKFSPLPNGLLVISPNTICRITTSPQVKVDTIYIEKRKEVFISDFFEINGSYYNVNNRAFICLNNLEGGYEILTGLPIGIDMNYSFIHGEFAYFGASNSKMYRFDGENLSEFSFDEQEYIAASIPTGGVSVDENHFAISTLNGGCIVINANNGETAYTLNFLNGLPDNEVYSLETDSFGGLWLAHGMGISRVDLSLPIKSYNHFSGLTGNLLSVVIHKDNLYVGTNEGLFVLNEKRDYKAIHVKSKSVIKSQQKNEPDPEVPKTVEEKKRGFLYRIFNRRSKQADKADAVPNPQPKSTKIPIQPTKKEQKRTIYQLQSISHKYDKVKGVDGKVKQLVESGKRLYAASNLGIFEVKGNTATRIIGDLNVSYFDVLPGSSQHFVIGAEGGAYLLHKAGSRWKLVELAKDENHLVVSVAQVKPGYYLISNEFDVLYAQHVGAQEYKVETIPFPNSNHPNPVVRIVDAKPYVFCSNGTYVFNQQAKTLNVNSNSTTTSYKAIDFSQSGRTLIKQGETWRYACSESNDLSKVLPYLNLLDEPNYINATRDSSLLVINRFSEVYKISQPSKAKQSDSLGIFIKRVVDNNNQMLTTKGIELTYSNNSLKVVISSPSYVRENAVKYQHKILGITDQWSEWTPSPILEIPFLPSGNHTIQIRATNLLGQHSKILEIPVFIKPPIWQTLWFYIVIGVILLLTFYSILKIRERNLKREKEILEQKIKERTKTIEEQNNTLRTQRDQIYKQNEEITQSISYAREIQSAVMPSKEIVSDILKNYFILFRPRDIVSGDFYWVGRKNDLTIVVAADCTGHGVPGAFMSMMGVSFLNEIVNVEGVTQPDMILGILRNKIISTLWQTGKEGEALDGMDMSVCVYSNGMRKMMYAGAYNTLYIVRNDKLLHFKGDNMPVGTHPKQNIPFTYHTIDLFSGDNIYIFSDGYVDQFGGPKGRKFMIKPFKQLLSSISNLQPVKQKQTLEDTLDKWQAHHDQVDDILVIGVQLL